MCARIQEVKFGFDDVMIVPRPSKDKSTNSRLNIKVKRFFDFGRTKFKAMLSPIMISNMDVTGTIDMHSYLYDNYFVQTVLAKQIGYEEIESVPRQKVIHSYITVGTDYNKGIEKINKICTLWPNLCGGPFCICVDAANGYTKKFVEAVKKYREEFPYLVIMAGNVVTSDMTAILIEAGADIVKIGIGGGSACTTRLKTGVGYPQLSAVLECSEIAHSMGKYVCSDGGCRTPSDICKALCAGADFVMIGGMMAGTDLCNGKIIKNKGQVNMEFYGMASKTAQDKHNGGVEDYRTAEGKTVLVPYKGTSEKVIKDILGGIRSCCTYIGVNKVEDMSQASFVITREQENKIFS